MRLSLACLEKPLDINEGCATVLQVENSGLFARLVLLLSGKGSADLLGGFSFWDSEDEINFYKQAIFISDPLKLPWEDRQLLGVVVKKLEKEFLEDEGLRQSLQEAEQILSGGLVGLSQGLNAEYGFSIAWDFKRYLKTLGFGVRIQSYDVYLDNLIKFMSFVLDTASDKVLVFVNLKTFLSKKDIIELYDYINFSKLRVLMLENKADACSYEYEHKRVVDLEFLEY